jgi:pilus assembly protein CpaF
MAFGFKTPKHSSRWSCSPSAATDQPSPAGHDPHISHKSRPREADGLTCRGAENTRRGRLIVCSTCFFVLKFDHPDWLAMQTRQAGLEGTGEVRLRELVKQSLRMRPSRMIIGEVRSEECLDLLLALNAGLPGLATIHANSAREALVKMCTLPLLAGAKQGRWESAGPRSTKVARAWLVAVVLSSARPVVRSCWL